MPPSCSPGERVLILAAAGGVGSLLVQLARRRGADVIAAASSRPKLDVDERLGANRTVDYSGDSWPDVVAASGPVDVVFDGVGGTLGGAALSTLRAGARRVAFGQASGDGFASLDQRPDISDRRGAPTGAADNRQLVIGAIELAASGELLPTVGQRVPLDDAAGAHAAIEARRPIGKTILIP